ncbi:hypothetical protein JCM6882_001209 [Rhodosporidiobolus microsporus]
MPSSSPPPLDDNPKLDSAAFAPPPLLPLDLPTTPPEADLPAAVELKTYVQHQSYSPLLSFFRARPFCVAKVFPPSFPGAQDPFDSSLLSASLAHVLSAYPHFAGKLRLARADDVGRPYQKRFGRIWVEYGMQNDPGVSFTFLQRDEPVKSVLPQEVGDRITDSSVLSQSPFMPDFADVVELRPSSEERPSLAIRVTRFSDGAAVIAVLVLHPLADATTLNRFVSDWGDVHRALLLTGSTSSIPLPSRPLSTETLDAISAGDLDSPFPNPDIEAQHRLLSRLEYDLWARPELHPPGAVHTSALHPAVAAEDAARGGERGEPVPWSTCDFAAPTVRRAVELSPEEVQRIWRRAQASSVVEGGELVKVTAHDAVVAHFWRLSIRARHLAPTTIVTFGPTISARSRLSPSLPPNCVGSPMFLLKTQLRSSDLLSSDGLAIAASSIRRVINTATPSNIAAILHHTAHQLDPLRIATAFASSTHIASSSWIHAGAYNADFGTGAPSLSRFSSPPVDGLFILDEVAAEAWEGQRWWERGAVMHFSLREDVLERMLMDPELRG